MTAFAYIMTNRRDGTLYLGVTSNLPKRSYEHRGGSVEGLVYYEASDDIRDALQRERTIKHWPRTWEVRLIHGVNPEWEDLYSSIAHP